MSPTVSSIVTALGGVLAGAAATLTALAAVVARSRRDLNAARHALAHDPLTGLASRPAALDRLDHARRRRRPVGVALMDLDGFKAINDTFTHRGGDDVLCQIAQRLRALPEPVELAARLHGDEFLLIVSGGAAQTETAAHAAWQAIADTPVAVADQVIEVTASVGVAATDAGIPHHQLVDAADFAMYQAKTNRARVHLHQPFPDRPSADRPRARDRSRRPHRDRHPTSPRPTSPPPPTDTFETRTSHVPTDLYFDLAAALRLAEHAVAAATHELSFSEHNDGLACAGALVWVADDGTYLMSNGRPPLLADLDDPTSNVVVYAHGYGPGSDHDLLGVSDVGSDDIGFDDFAEHLHLTNGRRPLIDLLRAAAARGYPWLLLQVDGDVITTRVSRSGPPDEAT